MSESITLTATIRTDVGKGASRRLRRLEDKVPAIIYGGDTAPQKLTLSGNEILKASQIEAFYSQILNISIDGSVESAVIRICNVTQRVVAYSISIFSASAPTKKSTLTCHCISLTKTHALA